MTTISYCTTCKDRLWQLEQTLPINILQTNENIDIVLLDYHSDDGLEKYIRSNYEEYLDDGRLKYFKLVTPMVGFDMAYAKQIVHLLSNNDVLFNLDADNHIGETVSELIELPLGKMLLPRLVKGTHTARCGRLGIHKTDYINVGGYDIDILGMKNDDGDLVHRAWLAGIRYVFSVDLSEPIPQSREQKFMHIREDDYELSESTEVISHDGKVTIINLRDMTITNKDNL